MGDHFGPYVLMSPIGRGSTGKVWKALREGTEAPCAVKVLSEDLTDDAETRTRFSAEATALQGHNLPGVVRVWGAVEDGDRLGIVMDLVEGPNLRHWLAERPPLTPAQACVTIAQCAEGVAAAHAIGIVHRDLKPENVLISNPGSGPVALITDFGLARLTESSSVTRSSRFAGTTDYVAPEVIRGVRASAAADVYALGVIFYECLTGWRPFRGSAAAIMQQHLATRPLRPEGVPDPLWAVIEQMLSKDPDGRPTSSNLADDLRKLSSQLQDAPARLRTDPPPVTEAIPETGLPTQFRNPRPAPASPLDVVEPLRASAGRKRAIALVTAGLLVIGSGAAWAMQRPGNDGSNVAADGAASKATESTASPDAHSSSSESAPSSTPEETPGALVPAPGVSVPGEGQSAAASEAAASEAAASEAAASEAAASEAAEREAAEREAAEREAAEREAAERAAAERAAAERAAAERAAAERAAAERAAAETPQVFNFVAKEDLDGRSTKDIDDRTYPNMYRKGDTVGVVCQAQGGKAYGSRIWDYTIDGVWVPDKYVYTGTDDWAPAVPRCK